MQGRRLGGVTLRVKKWVDCKEPPLMRLRVCGLKLGTGPLKDIWRSGPHGQRKPVIEAFLLQLQEALCSQAHILTGDFNYPGICQESNTAGCKQFRRLLKCTEDNFLVQVLNKPARDEMLLDLVLIEGDEKSWQSDRASND